MSDHTFCLLVPPDEEGLRLDLFLAGALPHLSRSRIQQLVREGLATVDGLPQKASLRLRGGQQVTLTQPPPPESSLPGQDIPLDIVYEDAHLVVVNKTAGMVVHPAAGNPDHTLVNALLHHFHHLPGAESSLRPGIVHRLDKDTSGLLVAARDEHTLRHLQEQFREHSIDRRYRALVLGRMNPPSGRVESLIGRHLGDRQRFASRDQTGRPAVTHWRTLCSFRGLVTLVECKLETGRTHQIRVHLSELGFPVVGDRTYGATTRRARALGDRETAQLLADAPRQMLHAYRLGFVHPVTGEKLLFTVDDPPDMAQMLVALEHRLGT